MENERTYGESGSSKREKKKLQNNNVNVNFHTMREWETIEDTIAELEEKIESIGELAKVGSDFTKAQELSEAQENRS